MLNMKLKPKHFNKRLHYFSVNNYDKEINCTQEVVGSNLNAPYQIESNLRTIKQTDEIQEANPKKKETCF